MSPFYARFPCGLLSRFAVVVSFCRFPGEHRRRDAVFLLECP